MSNYLTTDTELKSVADKIRSKSGGTNDLVFPSGFVNEIGNIVTGGGDIYYTSSTGLLYTPIMTIDVTMEATKSNLITTTLDRYGNMPFLEELTLIGRITSTPTAGNITNGEEYFYIDKYPLLKKLHIIPTEVRDTNGNVIDPSSANYNLFKFGHYTFSKTNLEELVLGKLGGPYFYGGGYFRKKDENGNSIYTVGSTVGLTLKIYTDSYK